MLQLQQERVHHRRGTHGNGSTIKTAYAEWELRMQEQRMRSQRQFAMLYDLGLQTRLNSVQVCNVADSAVWMNGP